MYRPEQKQAFLEYYRNYREDSTVQLMERIFNSTELVENQFNKDVSEFNQIEVLELLKSYNSSSPRRLMSNCKFLSDYYIWCSQVEKLVSGIINPFDKSITDNMIDNIIPKEDLNKKYFTKEYLIEELNDKVPDVTNQFIAYALFNGITVEELINLKIGDLDFDNNKVKLITGREIIVDTLFKHLMINANDQTQYFADGIEIEDIRKRYTYGESDYVIKKCGVKECDAVRPLYINFRIRKIKEQMENEFISLSTLYKNGLVNYIKEQFAKKNVSLKDAILHPINGKLYTYDEETQQYIYDFGSKMEVKILRMEIKDYLDLL